MTRRPERLAAVDQLVHERRRHTSPPPRRIDGDQPYVSGCATIHLIESRGAHTDRNTVCLRDERDLTPQVTDIPEPGSKSRVEKRGDERETA
jgi:hypothetical protein